MRTSTISRSTTLVIISALLAALTATPVSAGSGAVEFGRFSTGSGCIPPECFDDASFHSLDRMLPGAVAVRSGETVEFDVEGFHQVVIFEPGVRPRDVEVGGPFPFVFDPFAAFPATVIATGGLTADFAWTPTAPGKYLVICNIAPHFEEAQMWGWVHVR